MRRSARCIDPRDTLRDHPPCTGSERGLHQIAGAFVADARITHERIGHQVRRQRGRQIGQLMDHDVRPRGYDGVRQRGCIEHIDDDRFDADLTQRIELCGRSCRAGYVMTGIAQQRRQTLTDGAACARKEDSHCRCYFPSMVVRFLSLLSTTKMASSFAGSVVLGFSLTR